EAKQATRRLQEIGGWQAHPRSDDHQLEAGPRPAIPRLPRADQPPPLGRDPAPYTNYLTGPRGFFQDLALLTQDPVLPPQTVELSPLVTIKPGPGAASDVRAFHPLPERVAAHAQLVSYLLQRPPALAEQPYRLDLELKRVGRISGSSL